MPFQRQQVSRTKGPAWKSTPGNLRNNKGWQGTTKSIYFICWNPKSYQGWSGVLVDLWSLSFTACEWITMASCGNVSATKYKLPQSLRSILLSFRPSHICREQAICQADNKEATRSADSCTPQQALALGFPGVWSFHVKLWDDLA